MEHTTIVPASASLESIERFLPSDMGIVPLAAVARALAGFSRDQLGSAIEVLIALMDVADGDPEAENATDAEDDFGTLSPNAQYFTSGPGCLISDQDVASYVEWHTKPGAAKRNGQAEMTVGHEDDEDDDPDTGVEDEVGLLRFKDGPGCPISDPDSSVDDQRCDDPDQDLEREQMPNDVPMPMVWSAEYNIFNDQRVALGITNLQSSFVTNGREVRSADSGAIHVSRGWAEKSGAPV